jgi:hypothetical protein
MSSRLTSLFRRDPMPREVVGAPIEGPVIADPGACAGGGCAPLPQSAAPPLVPPPHPVPWNEAQRMPYQP